MTQEFESNTLETKSCDLKILNITLWKYSERIHVIVLADQLDSVYGMKTCVYNLLWNYGVPSVTLQTIVMWACDNDEYYGVQ